MCREIKLTGIEFENLVSDTLNVAWYTVDGDYERNVNSCGIERMIELWQYNKYPLYEFLGYTTRVEKNYKAVATFRDYKGMLDDFVSDVYSASRVKYNREWKKLTSLNWCFLNSLPFAVNPFTRIVNMINDSQCFEEIQSNKIGKNILNTWGMRAIDNDDVLGEYKAMKNIEGKKFSKWTRQFLLEYAKDCYEKNYIDDDDYANMKNEIEMFSQYYSTLLEKIKPTTKEYKVVLSIDPRDYMRCSHGTDWDSCHQLGNMHGDGAIEYCISPMALIAYIEDVEKNSVNEDCTPLVWRQIVYCDLTHNRFIGSRQYRHVDKNATYAIQDIIRECGKNLGLEYNNLYDNSNSHIQDKCRLYVKTGRYDYAYNDICLYSGLDNELWLLETDSEKIDDIIVNCVEKIPCLDCGCLFEGHRDYFFMCENCGGGIWCPCCESYHDEDDMIWVESEGEYLCEDCVHEYYEYCIECDEYHLRENMYEVGYCTGEYVCESCKDYYYTYCDECDCLEKNDNVHCYEDENGNEHWVCDDCADNCIYECEQCGKLFYNTNEYENLVCCEECNDDYNATYNDDEDEDEE